MKTILAVAAAAMLCGVSLSHAQQDQAAADGLHVLPVQGKRNRIGDFDRHRVNPVLQPERLDRAEIFGVEVRDRACGVCR